jgi:hypothetical protein
MAMQRVEMRSDIDAAIPNDSGTGPAAKLPEELDDWNWGAFLLTWVWAVGNKVWIGLVALAPVPFANLAVGILLGIKGNEWAWQNKKWKSIKHFRHTQRIWLYWGLAALVAPFIGLIGAALIIIGILGYYHIINF